LLNPSITHALDYAKQGLSVIPLKKASKKPCIEWEQYQEERAEEELIRSWWERWPEANLAIITGAISRIVVLDVDGTEGEESLKKNRLAVPITPTARTGGGGLHYYFKHPDRPCKNFTKKYPGIDFRGDGGYVVAPPSLHSSGNHYQWIVAPGDKELADPPDWLLELIEEQKTGGRLEPDEWAVDIPEGTRNNEITRRAGSLLSKGYSLEAAFSMLLAINEQHCKPPLPKGEIKQIVESVAKKERLKEAERDFSDKTNSRPLIACLADIEPEEVAFLWRPYIPIGKLTLLEGDPGIGKTWAALQIAAAVSKGDPFPDPGDGTPKEGRELANVVYMSAEDGLADTLRPRLDAVEADVRNIYAITGQCYVDEETGEEKQIGITLQDINALRQAMKRLKPQLVVVDPLQAYMGASVDMHRANEVRPILSNLAKLAEEYKCAVLLIRHLGKSQKDRAIYRGLGSVDFAAAARSILLAGQDPKNPQSRAIIQVKSSLAEAGPSIGYALQNGKFHWTGISPLTAENVLAPATRGDRISALDEAKGFLRNTLSDGPLPPKTVQKTAKELGISKSTLRKAREELGVISKQEEGKPSSWIWILPADEIEEDFLA